MNEAGHSAAARYEFRLFGPRLAELARQLPAMFTPTGTSEQADVYIVGMHGEDWNVKIRERELQIKQMVKNGGDLQKWLPRMAPEFPLTPAQFEAVTGWHCETPVEPHVFLDRLCKSPGRAVCLHVRKTRSHYDGDEISAEFARVVINGAYVESLAIEGSDASSLLAAKSTLGLDSFDNVSYVSFLHRLTGLARLPDNSPYRVADYG